MAAIRSGGSCLNRLTTVLGRSREVGWVINSTTARGDRSGSLGWCCSSARTSASAPAPPSVLSHGECQGGCQQTIAQAVLAGLVTLCAIWSPPCSSPPMQDLFGNSSAPKVGGFGVAVAGRVSQAVTVFEQP